MMNVEFLRNEYTKLKKLEDTDDGIFEFKDFLLEKDDNPTLEFHFEIMQDNDDPYLHRDILSFYGQRNNKEKASEFLYHKYKLGINNIQFKAKIIRILGEMKFKFSRDIAVQNINNIEYSLRYSSIIVLGWVSTEKDLSILNNQMITDTSPKLRGYSATAMRQIWFNYPETDKEIVNYIYFAIKKEKNEDALMFMLVSVQEVLCKKFGVKESSYGDTSGKVEKAKEKFINYYNKNIKK